MMSPKITVLMPVYNAEQFLREAMDSILQQTFHDFEFLIIDDGSTDSSISIIQQYNDPRIRLLRNEKNLGISPTLNKGIELASSDLIARMDADDISYLDRLQKQYDYMMAHPDCALLSSWARVITHDKKFVRMEKYRSNFYYYNLTFECWMYHPTVLFRRRPVMDVGMYSMPYSEDYDLFWKLSVNYEIGNLAEPLIDYRLSPTSLNTVLRKEEYDIANEENVVRNIRFYLGSDFSIDKACLECLRHNFIPLIKLGSVSQILNCLKTLDAFTQRILEKENVNRDPQSIQDAAYFKKRFILTQFGRELPIPKAVHLLIATGSWSILTSLIADFFTWKVDKVKRVVSEKISS
jgi:glycosyltransferase involved in cell wall biosynthesis